MNSEQFLQTKSACRFCRIGSRRGAVSHDQIMHESDDYFAIASIGGFVEGWTLICPKSHILNLSSEYKKPEFMTFAYEVDELVSRTYGQTAVFEHGVRSQGSLTGCGTDHAHLHIVPMSHDFVSDVFSYDPKRSWEKTSVSEIERHVAEIEYLLMANSLLDLTENALLSQVEMPTSQFFRRALASQLNLNALSNYRDYPLEENAILTFEKISNSKLAVI